MTKIELYMISKDQLRLPQQNTIDWVAETIKTCFSHFLMLGSPHEALKGRFHSEPVSLGMQVAEITPYVHVKHVCPFLHLE